MRSKAIWRTILWTGLASALSLPAAAQDLSGYWSGVVEVSGEQMHVGLRVSKDKDGAWKATMDSLDQGAEGIEVASFELNGSELNFNVPSIAGAYRGTVAGDAITGKWTQSGEDLTLDWKRSTPPAPVDKSALLDEKTAMEDGRTYTQWFYNGKTAELWAKLSPQMQKVLGDESKLKAFRDQVADQAGAETKVTEETVKPAGKFMLYHRVATFEKAPDGIAVDFNMDAQGVVAGFTVRPAQQ